MFISNHDFVPLSCYTNIHFFSDTAMKLNIGNNFDDFESLSQVGNEKESFFIKP